MTSEPADPGGAEGDAAARVRAMLEQDAATAALGIEVLALGPGRATMRMTVRPDMVQGHGTCHGGIVFSLADSGRNGVTDVSVTRQGDDALLALFRGRSVEVSRPPAPRPTNGGP